MKTLVIGFLGIMRAATAFATEQAPESIPQFITLANYSMLPNDARAWYVAGILDADRVRDRRTVRLFKACLKDVSLNQITHIVDHGITRLTVGPANSMLTVVHDVLVTECARRGYKLPPVA